MPFATPTLADRRAAEHAALAAAQAGDLTALETFVADLTPLLASHARRLAARGGIVGHDDLLAVGQAAVVAVVDHVDPTVNPNVVAYLTTRARGAMIDHLRRHGPRSRYGRDRTMASLDELTAAGGPDPAAHTPAVSYEDREALRHAVAQLPDRQRHILVGHVVHERHLQDIAAELDLSPSRVGQLHAAALQTLRRLLAA